MQRRALCQLWLTCEDDKEAYKIAAALLEARLIVCAKHMPLAADYWWKGAVNHSEEVLMVMDTSLELFDDVDAIVKKLHSYDVYVLQAMPLLRMSHDAEVWLMGELKGSDSSSSSDSGSGSGSGENLQMLGDSEKIANADDNANAEKDGVTDSDAKVSVDADANEVENADADTGKTAAQGTLGDSGRQKLAAPMAPSPARKGTRINIL